MSGDDRQTGGKEVPLQRGTEPLGRPSTQRAIHDQRSFFISSNQLSIDILSASVTIPPNISFNERITADSDVKTSGGFAVP